MNAERARGVAKNEIFDFLTPAILVGDVRTRLGGGSDHLRESISLVHTIGSIRVGKRGSDLRQKYGKLSKEFIQPVGHRAPPREERPGFPPPAVSRSDHHPGLL
ncbi:hypothetical protein [Actinoplanes sp. NPDC051859]|uniref:hypothetical protein n=1 Tax=Actinoplanes sp. NPDC051859 TaxID=3363909 RepID=UPI003787509F